MSARTVIDEDSVPGLPRGVRLKHDEARDQWVVLAPERMFVLDSIALEILRGCDGSAHVAAIVDDLASRYDAPRADIQRDVVELLQDFADKGVIVA
jgi:pyrroloquinoline quinone biosynthesis protein D